MRRARMILNPLPRFRKAWSTLPAFTDLLEDVGIRVDLTFTKMNQMMTESVAHAVAEGYDLVIAGGGDGTVSEVAAGLVGTSIPLGILPFGTFNNIAHSLKLPLDLHAAATTIAQGFSRSIDVGVANGTYFFEAAGIGLDAQVFPIGEDIKGGHYEKVLQGAARFLRYRTTEFTLKIDGFDMRLKAPMIVVANGPFYGAGFNIAPQASLYDGLLDLVTLDCNKAEIARHFALSARNREHREYCISMQTCREITISTELDLPAHADGKPIRGGPFTCTVVPHALRVVMPQI